MTDAGTGAPVRGVTVTAYIDGTQTTAGTGTTGSSGSYQIRIATPGPYQVQFVDPAANYVPQWFNGKSSQLSADQVTVRAHGATSKVNARLIPEPPIVTGIDPSSGSVAGDDPITITGSRLAGATGVTFGGTAATITSNSGETTLVVTDPAHAAGPVDVVVSTLGGQSSPITFTYFIPPPPGVTAISPTSGPIAGGTSVTITGTNLAHATTVAFGSAHATITSNTGTQIVAVSPAHAAGVVDVKVTTAGGTSTTSASDQFTYVAAATISAVGTLITHTNEPSALTEAIDVSPAATGNLLTLAIEVKFPSPSSFTASTVTGGGVTSWHKAFSYLTSDDQRGEELWYGVVTSAGSSTVTVTYTSNAGSALTGSASSLDLQEFSSSSGGSTTWSLDQTGKKDPGTSDTTFSYPTLTPTGSSELYFGYLAVSGSVSAGSTPGFMYQEDARSNQVAYNVSVSSTTSPTSATSGSAETWASIGMLIGAV